MLICFYGSDIERARAEARAFIERDGRVPNRIVSSEWYPGRSIESAETVPLFGGPQLFVLDTPTQLEEFFDEVSDSLEAFKASPHTFVLIEEGLLAAQLRAITPWVDDIFEYKKTQKEQAFNTFALADALAAKDKRALWLKLRGAYEAGQVAEAIIGMFMWQLKALLLAARTKTAAEADMKEFPYNKAKRALSAFAPGEVEKLIRSLTRIRHEGHSGRMDIDDALEQWVLSL